jgi:hypothetical protein
MFHLEFLNCLPGIFKAFPMLPTNPSDSALLLKVDWIGALLEQKKKLYVLQSYLGLHYPLLDLI